MSAAGATKHVFYNGVEREQGQFKWIYWMQSWRSWKLFLEVLNSHVIRLDLQGFESSIQ